MWTTYTNPISTYHMRKDSCSPKESSSGLQMDCSRLKSNFCKFPVCVAYNCIGHVSVLASEGSCISERGVTAAKFSVRICEYCFSSTSLAVCRESSSASKRAIYECIQVWNASFIIHHHSKFQSHSSAVTQNYIK